MNNREKQMYQEKPTQRTCSNCAYYSSEFAPPEWAIKEYGRKQAMDLGFVSERKKRCTLGGFSVKKTARCDVHKLKDL